MTGEGMEKVGEKVEEEIGTVSDQVLLHDQPAARVELTRLATHALSCGVGKHCTEHGHARRPVYECCRCGTQFEEVSL